MIKGLSLLFCYGISRIRLERDEGKGYLWGGRKEIDRCDCDIRNGERWCGEDKESQFGKGEIKERRERKRRDPDASFLCLRVKR